MQDWRTVDVSKLTREEADALLKKIEKNEGPYEPKKYTPDEEKQLTAIMEKIYEITEEEKKVSRENCKFLFL